MRHKMWTIKLLTILFIVILSYGQTKENTENKEQNNQKEVYKPNIAVLTLKKSDGVTNGDAELITDRLNAELFKTGRVNLLERAQINEILKEQGFQSSGACTEDECLVEMGQILGVEEIVAGSLGKLGSMFMLNLRVIDVTSGKIIRVVSRDIKGNIENIVFALPEIAEELTGLKKKEKEKTPKSLTKKESDNFYEKIKNMKPVSGKGMIVISTVPKGADVYLNGVNVGKTPYINTALLPNHYELKIVKANYEDYTESFDVYDKTVKKIDIGLIYKYGILCIKSLPDSAGVYVDDKFVGYTPYCNDKLHPGNVVLKLKKDGFADIKEKIEIKKNRVDTLNYKLVTQEILDSLKAVKREQSKGGRWARRIIFSMLTGAGVGSGVYFYKKAKDYNNDVKMINEEYSQLIPDPNNPVEQQYWQELHDKAEKSAKKAKRNKLYGTIAYGTGGLFGFFFILSIPF